MDKINAPSVTPLLLETYLAVANNCEGTRMFLSNYALVHGEKKDITEYGEKSCAFAVTGIIRMFDLIQSLHATVPGALRDMERSGWFEIKHARPGAILLWDIDPELDLAKQHQHLGIYLDLGKVVSSYDVDKQMSIHSLIYKKRHVHKCYWHPKLSY